MDDAQPDRSMKKLRVDLKVLADVVEIMSRDGRRAVIKLDDERIDSLAGLTAGQLHAASEIDVSSFWVNPDRPTFGRRHFVYFLSGAEGTRYFGDSISPEVTKVCTALDEYFGRAVPLTDGSSTVSAKLALPAWWPSGWLFETPQRAVATLGTAVVVIALIAFMVGRWSVGEPDIYARMPERITPSVSPQDTTPPEATQPAAP